jgi:hypothetical protein
MIIGFTGTRNGLTDEQDEALSELVNRLQPGEVHHGMCVGADEAFHKIVVAGEYFVNIEGHPPTIPDHMMEYNEEEFFKIHFPRPYLERNRDIVKQSQMLIACPEGPEVIRSGTWSTIRYLKKHNWVKDHYIVWPSGLVEKNPDLLVGFIQRGKRFKI